MHRLDLASLGGLRDFRSQFWHHSWARVIALAGFGITWRIEKFQKTVLASFVSWRNFIGWIWLTWGFEKFQETVLASLVGSSLAPAGFGITWRIEKFQKSVLASLVSWSLAPAAGCQVHIVV